VLAQACKATRMPMPMHLTKVKITALMVAVLSDQVLEKVTMRILELTFFPIPPTIITSTTTVKATMAAQISELVLIGISTKNKT
jgi:hypothetical protein